MKGRAPESQAEAWLMHEGFTQAEDIGYPGLRIARRHQCVMGPIWDVEYSPSIEGCGESPGVNIELSGGDGLYC